MCDARKTNWFAVSTEKEIWLEFCENIWVMKRVNISKYQLLVTIVPPGMNSLRMFHCWTFVGSDMTSLHDYNKQKTQNRKKNHKIEREIVSFYKTTYSYDSKTICGLHQHVLDINLISSVNFGTKCALLHVLQLR